MNIIDIKQLGQLIKKRRKDLGYSQEFISNNTGLSASFISNIENGKDTAEIGKVLQLVQMLGLDFIIEERA